MSSYKFIKSSRRYLFSPVNQMYSVVAMFSLFLRPNLFFFLFAVINQDGMVYLANKKHARSNKSGNTKNTVDWYSPFIAHSKVLLYTLFRLVTAQLPDLKTNRRYSLAKQQNRWGTNNKLTAILSTSGYRTSTIKVRKRDAQ
jgi:hypothetical protein